MKVLKYEVLTDFSCSNSLYLKGDILYIGEYIQEYHYLTASVSYEQVRIFNFNRTPIQTITKLEYLRDFKNNIKFI